MSDVTFDCPQCHQPIKCGAEFSGYQIVCPLCQGQVIVPPAATKGAMRVTTTSKSAGSASLLRQPGSSVHGGGAGKMKAMKWAGAVLLVGIGLLVGWPMVKKWQSNKSQSSENPADGMSDSVDPNSLAATDPARSQSPGPAAGETGNTLGALGALETVTATGAVSSAELIVPPNWSLDADKAVIQKSRVNGSLGGTNFVADQIRLHKTPAMNILSFKQSHTNALDEKEILIYLRLRPGETLEGKTLDITRDSPVSEAQIARRWRPDRRYGPQQKFFSKGYRLKLELGRGPEEKISGKIYLALPDPEQTVIAGEFNAESGAPAAGFQPIATGNPAAPAAPPPSTAPAMDPKMRERYGLK